MTVSSATAATLAAGIAADRAAWRAAKNAGPTSVATSDPDVTVTFSAEAVELMRRREVAATSVQQFADITAQAQAANAQANPKAFLNSLSSAQMEVLRQVHSLADPIHIATLSQEGAANLLVPPGCQQDMNNDGLTTTGAGNSFAFPPRNAPASFKAAWANASEGLSPLEIPTQMIFAVGLANIGREPGDPNWQNPYADPGYDYQGAVNGIMDSIEYAFKMGMMSNDHYQRDISFYRRLSEAMA